MNEEEEKAVEQLNKFAYLRREWFSERQATIILNLITKLQKENVEKDKKIEKALDLIFQYGQIDGAHHKAWVIDQTVRILIKDKYDEWIKNYVYDEETGDTYSWDKGIAP